MFLTVTVTVFGRVVPELAWRELERFLSCRGSLTRSCRMFTESGSARKWRGDVMESIHFFLVFLNLSLSARCSADIQPFGKFWLVYHCYFPWSVYTVKNTSNNLPILSSSLQKSTYFIYLLFIGIISKAVQNSSLFPLDGKKCFNLPVVGT